MNRTTGIVLGAMLMLGIFLLALSTATAPPAVKTLVSTEPGQPAAEAGTTQAAPVGNNPNNLSTRAADVAQLEESRLPGSRVDRLMLDPQSWNQSMGAYESVVHKEATQASRYLVWSPFHSEWAAQGFARRLTLATDVPVEVVNEAPGNYQVVFSYRDENERQALVRRIEDVTGLELE
jgi:hypothetical protein